MVPTKPSIDLFQRDSKNQDPVRFDSIDLVATHPPYAGVIRYTGERVSGDLSRLKLEPFLTSLRQIAAESFRVLEQFLDEGFILREDIIKIQHKMKSTREKWRGTKYDFYLLAHEHLYVFRKPAEGERMSDFMNTMKWC